MRPSWDKAFLQICEVMADRGTCQRLQVGSAIVKDNVIISTGYNGAPRGMPHCNHEPLTVDPHVKNGHCINAEHAERNALLRAGTKSEGATLYSTVSPCLDCLRLCVSAGIKRVVFINWFRESEDSKALAAVAGIQLSQVYYP